MAAKKVGELIREARTAADLTQEALAKQIDGVSASDISKTERGEKDLTKEQLKQIAKITGVTQKSLLEAPSNLKETASSASKVSSASKKKSETKKTSSASKSGSSSGSSMKVSAAEKKLVELYRAADSDTKKAAVALLKGESTSTEDVISNLLSNVISNIGKK